MNIANTVTNSISRLNMDLTCKLGEEILKGLDENEYMQGNHMH